MTIEKASAIRGLSVAASRHLPDGPIDLAVICFLPDPGHVLPLLRLASRLKELSGCRVGCYLPSSFAKTIRHHGFDHYELPMKHPPPLSGLIATGSDRSMFYNSISIDLDLSDRYWTPFREAVSRELEAVLESLGHLKPHTMLCDSHVFLDWYERLACACRARLIVNRSEGSLRWLQRPFVRTYGLTNRADFVQRLGEATGWAAETWFRSWRRLRHPARRQRVMASKIAADKRVNVLFNVEAPTRPLETTYVSSGLAILESSLREVAKPLNRTEIVLAPIASADGDLAHELREWLNAHKCGSVIYVSFGTMISLSQHIVDVLVQGLIDVGEPVIWSSPASQRGLIERYTLPINFRVETFVAQRALLASDRIGCFVTHGGAGSAQEAAMCGKPVLCIPVMWDQPYNSSVLHRLGMGRTLSKRALTAQEISSEIRDLINNPIYAASARQVAAQIREHQRSAREAALLYELMADKKIERAD